MENLAMQNTIMPTNIGKALFVFRNLAMQNTIMPTNNGKALFVFRNVIVQVHKFRRSGASGFPQYTLLSR